MSTSTKQSAERSSRVVDQDDANGGPLSRNTTPNPSASRNMTGAERQAKWRERQNELARDAETLRNSSIAFVIERRLKNRNINDNAGQIATAIQRLLEAIDPEDFAEWARRDFKVFNSSIADPPLDERLLRFIANWMESRS